MDTFLVFLAMASMVALYFIPTFVAYKRKHHNALAICALNILFGCTGIGWGVALVWALTSVKQK